MKIRLDWRKSAQENAAAYYSLSKEYAKKEEGARGAIAETEKEIEKARSEGAIASAKAAADAAPKMKRKREWFEKYRWFYTSEGKLVVAGRDAKQNDLLVSKVMADADLFFHADIQGAPATILVGGKKASGQEKKEAAQFAASHSSAWKIGSAAVDVYAVEKGQLSKHAQGGYVGAGGFAISGEREWFRATPLGLAIGMEGAVAACLPICHPKASSLPVLLSPGNYEKGKAAKLIAGALKANADEILLALPPGRFSIKEKK
ncbi:MAG: NFACT RNA binding domain-containing protein [Candidatus Anstonellaceae archaeon]